MKAFIHKGLVASIASLLLVSFTAAVQPDNPPNFTVTDLKKFLPDLRKGGYVIYFRHMRTDHNQEDRRPVDLNDCNTQRPLHEEGRKQARKINQAFKQMKIPVGLIYSSPYCRCRETAKLAFGNAIITHDLYFAMGLSRQGKQAKGEALRRLLAEKPVDQRNTVIVAHTANLQEAIEVWPKPEGVAYIFKPDGKGKFSIVARIEPHIWAQANRE